MKILSKVSFGVSVVLLGLSAACFVMLYDPEYPREFLITFGCVLLAVAILLFMVTLLAALKHDDKLNMAKPKDESLKPH